MAVELASAYVSIVPSAKGIGKGIQKELGGLDSVASSKGRSMGSRLASGLATAAKAGVAAAGVAIGVALVSGIKSGINEQNATATLSGLYGSLSQAKKMMTDLRKVSASSPIDYTSYTKAAQSLAYAGVKGKTAVKTIKNMGLAITAVGGSSENMGRATDAVLKMVNAGKVGLDSLQQLSDAGVPIISGLAKHMGVSMSQVNKMASAGKIGLDDVLSVMKNGTGKTFQSMLKAGEKAQKTFGNQWKAATNNVSTAIGHAIQPILKLLAPVVGKAGKLLAGFIDNLSKKMGKGGLEQIFVTIGQVLKPFVDAFKPLVPVLAQVAAQVSPMGLAFKALAPFLPQIAKAIGSLAATIGKALISALTAILPALTQLAGILVGALQQALRIVLPIIVQLVSALGPVFATLLKALAPLFVVVAQVVGALLKALMPIAGVLLKLIASLLPPLLSLLGALVPVFVIVVKAIQPLVKLLGIVLVPLIKLLGAIVTMVFTAAANIIKIAVKIVVGLLHGIVGAVKLVVFGIQHFGKINKIIWNAFRKVLRVTWGWAKKNVIDPVIHFFTKKIPAALAAFGRANHRIWNAVKTAIKIAYNWIANHTFRPLIAFGRKKIPAAFQAMKDLVSKRWTNLKNNIHAGYTWVKKHTFDPLRNLITKTIPNAFKNGVKSIGKAWNKVKAAAKKPVGFIVRSVYNDGLVKLWNPIANIVNKKWRLNPIKGFDTGGIYPGYTPGRDIGLAKVSGGEAIMRPEWTRAVGASNVHAMNAAARNGGAAGVRSMLADGLPGYSTGGIIKLGKWWQSHGARVAEGPGPFGPVHPVHMRGSLHYKKRAIDVNYGPGGENATEKAFFDRMIPKMRSLFPWAHTLWRVKGHYNHAHFDDSAGPGRIGGGLAALPGIKQFLALRSKLSNLGGGTFGKAAGQLVKKGITGMAGKAKDLFKNLFSGVGKAGSWIGANVSKGTAYLKGQAWARLHGLSGAQRKAMNYIIGHESGWNPRAQNPTSSAQGLPQMINSTARAYGMGSGVFSQLDAWLRYVNDRYGGPVKAANFWQRHRFYQNGAWDTGPKTHPATIHPHEMVLPEKVANVVRNGSAAAPVVNVTVDKGAMADALNGQQIRLLVDGREMSAVIDTRLDGAAKRAKVSR